MSRAGFFSIAWQQRGERQSVETFFKWGPLIKVTPLKPGTQRTHRRLSTQGGGKDCRPLRRTKDGTVALTVAKKRLLLSCELNYSCNSQLLFGEYYSLFGLYLGIFEQVSVLQCGQLEAAIIRDERCWPSSPEPVSSSQHKSEKYWKVVFRTKNTGRIQRVFTAKEMPFRSWNSLKATTYCSPEVQATPSGSFSEPASLPLRTRWVQQLVCYFARKLKSVGFDVPWLEGGPLKTLDKYGFEATWPAKVILSFRVWSGIYMRPTFRSRERMNGTSS